MRCSRRTCAPSMPTTSCRDRWSRWRWDAGSPRLPTRRYTYRLVFAPETIGAIVYLSRHLDHLRQRVRAGWVVTCIGDDRAFSYVPSRLGGTLAEPGLALRARRVGAGLGGVQLPRTGQRRAAMVLAWCRPPGLLGDALQVRHSRNITRASTGSTSSRRQVSRAGLDVIRRLYRAARVQPALAGGAARRAAARSTRALPNDQLQGKRNRCTSDDERARVLDRRPRRGATCGTDGRADSAVVEILDRLAASGVIRAVD